MNLSLVGYVLTAARRDKLFLSLLCIMIVGGCLSVFLSSSATIEQAQFSMVFMAGSLRLLGLLGLVLFVIFFIRRSFEARDVEFLLTRPITRTSFILSHAAAFSLLGFIVSLALTVSMALMCFKVGDFIGILYWSTGVICEYIFVVNVALFFAMVLASPVSASLATFGFYILSRLMGQLLYIAKYPQEGMPGYKIVSGVFQIISTMIPRLDLMTQTSWLLYGVGNLKDYIFIVVQAAVFVLLVLVATLIDLRRRQF